MPDTQKPTAPGNLRRSRRARAEVDLSWDASSDNVGVTGYKIYRDGTLIDDHRRDDVLLGHERHARDLQLRVRAHRRGRQPLRPEQHGHGHGQRARHREAHGARQPARDARRLDQVDLTWDASSDNVGVTGYEIYRDDTLIDTDRRDHVLLGHERRARHLQLRGARDRRGRPTVSDPSNTATVTVSPPDTRSRPPRRT